MLAVLLNFFCLFYGSFNFWIAAATTTTATYIRELASNVPQQLKKTDRGKML